ncbi:uncharacterized protein F4822DRAFT_270669 [Hypoxylon trugodes]|uniref:uncharacterized protein n=1 Tax=Hypoxylon trugodes TaxID=326681 RepID=UPI002198E29A|nr:uncharacterized protein F4822DRAFT_270669 [Hypoxylon trugodes]KAI1389134.1 hypothetical protein F4822DRAFT_270669 [Hypoxylon trugodes]
MPNLAKLTPIGVTIKALEVVDLRQMFHVPSLRIMDGILNIYGAICYEVRRVIHPEQLPICDMEIMFISPEILQFIHLWIRVINNTDEITYKGSKVSSFVALISTLFNIFPDPFEKDQPLMDSSLFIDLFRVFFVDQVDRVREFVNDPAFPTSEAMQLLRDELGEGEYTFCEDLDTHRAFNSQMKKVVTNAILCTKRSIIHTSCKNLGAGPRGALPGDQICILDQCSLPMILRRVGESWQFVGPCYIYGLSPHEEVERVKKGELKLEEFRIH